MPEICQNMPEICSFAKICGIKKSLPQICSGGTAGCTWVTLHGVCLSAKFLFTA